MPSQLETLGGAKGTVEQKRKFVALPMYQFYKGLSTNRNPLLDANTPFLYGHFYGATSNDGLLDGLNMEMSVRNTLIRRPGLSFQNTQAFAPAVSKPVNFKPTISTGEVCYIIIDTATAVYEYLANSNTKTLLWTKATGAGPTRFQQVANRLYAGDGVSNWVWNWFTNWTASTQYPAGTSILDANNKVQTSLGYGVSITSTSVSNNILTVNYTGTGVINQGDLVTIYGATTETQLNGINVSVLTAGSGTFTGAFTTANYGTTSDTGFAVVPARTGTSGSTIPSFTDTVGNTILDNTVVWQAKGTSVTTMGIIAPTVAPTVQNIAATIGNTWAATTYFWPNPLILDSNGNIQLLTTSGTTNSSVPVWNVTTGGTTTDGTAVWTNQGTGTRANNHAYNLGAFIAVTWTFTYQVPVFENPRTGQVTYRNQTLTFRSFFECTTAGTSSLSNTSVLWNGSGPVTLGATINDGTVIWTNVGWQVTRTSSATSSPTANVAGNVSNSVVVSTFTNIVDSNSNGESCVVAGLSGASAPTWLKTLGATTVETSGLTWSNTGPSGAAQTAAWVYAFTWANSVTGDESTASPLSTPIILGANSNIVVSGQGDPNWATDGVDTIKIYRSTEGNVVPFLLASIPAPLNGQAWSFVDTTLDPPNPGATLDTLITAPGFAVVSGVVTNFNDPPPTGITNFAQSLGRLWGSVGPVLYFSTGPDVTVGSPYTSWDVENFFDLPSTITRIWPTNSGIILFTTSGTYVLQGQGTTTNPFQNPVNIATDISLAWYDEFDFKDSTGVLYTSDRQLLQVSPSTGFSQDSFIIGDVLQSQFTPGQNFVCYHTAGLDQKIFIANSTSWYAVSAPNPPETGPPSVVWSPKAVITNGISAIGSVETSPGTHVLITIPNAGGNVFKRDLTVFTDNGTAYDAFAIIGSIVLAHPGSMALVGFATLDAIKVGAVPKIGYLFDELINQTNTPAFNFLDPSTVDPPQLDMPGDYNETVYNARYYFLQNDGIPYGRFINLRIEFGNDVAQNELISLTLYAAPIQQASE